MNFKGRQSLLLLLLLGFGKAFVSAAANGTTAARSSHWLEKYSPSPLLQPWTSPPAKWHAPISDRHGCQMAIATF